MITLDAFELQTLVGDLQRGGWIAAGRVIGDTQALEFGDQVTLDARNGAGWVDSDYRTYFEGHCLTGLGNITFDKWQSSAQVQIGTADNLLKGYLQDIGFTDQDTPQNDHQITDMNMAKIAEHIMRKHCNAIYNASGPTEGPVKTVNVDTANSTAVGRKNVRKSNHFWKRIQEIGGGDRAGEFYYSYFTRGNVYNYQSSPFFTTPSPTPVGDIDASLIRGTVRVVDNQANQLKRIGQVLLATQSAAKVITASTQFNSEYPQFPQGNGKPYQLGSGVWAENQARSDILAERLFKWLTRPYTLYLDIDVNLLLFGDDGKGLDLAQAVTVTYDGPADDGGSGVHIQFNQQKFYIYGATVRVNEAQEQAVATLKLEQDNG